MRPYVWTLFLPMFLGCSGKNVVAGEEKTSAEQLQSNLPSWCAEACHRFDSCQAKQPCDCEGDFCSCPSVSKDCPEECEAELTELSHSEHCADLGLQLQRCIDYSSCEVLNGSSRPDCYPDEDEMEACESSGGDVDSPPQSSGSGGTRSIDDGSSSGGTVANPGGAPVSCLDASGSGAAGSANMGGGAYVTCEETRDSCTDGHQYSWICVDEAGGRNFCSCFLDGAPVGALDPALTCPTTLEVNRACGWNLTD